LKDEAEENMPIALVKFCELVKVTGWLKAAAKANI